MGRRPMENSDKDKDCAEMIATDDPEAIVAFWKGEFAKFIYAKTSRKRPQHWPAHLGQNGQCRTTSGLSLRICWKASAFAYLTHHGQFAL